MTFSSSSTPSLTDEPNTDISNITEKEEKGSMKDNDDNNNFVDGCKKEQLELKLQELGITNYSFVSHYSPCDYMLQQEHDEGEDIVMEVKTLIWQLEFEDDSDDNNNDADDLHSKYIITAIHKNHRVNPTQLLSQIQSDYALSSLSNNKNKVKSIQLAPQEKAEFISGYKSGSIPPILHFTYKYTFHCLYLDKGIFAMFGEEKKKRKKNGELKLSIGSGSMDYSLVLSFDEFKNAIQQSCRQDEECKQHLCITSITATTSTTFKSARKQEKKNESKSPTQPTQAQKEEEQQEEKGPQKHISKRLRDAAGKKGKSNQVLELIKEAGDDFPSLMILPKAIQNPNTYGNRNHNTTTTTKTYPTKNALHLAAWKGDIASIHHLITASLSFGITDIINTISTGIGNYGKTPIFYAITQNRDDVVQYLLSTYPDTLNLLIVNNKGQSPCSMALSHLKEDTCDMLYEHETNQLLKGDEFVNYRNGYSDCKNYGDLDPRFEIDEYNGGDDVQEELEYYHECRNDYYEQHQGDDEEFINNEWIIPPKSGIPRTLRLTTSEKRKERANVHRKNAAKAAAALNLLSITCSSSHETGSIAMDENSKIKKKKNKKKKRVNPLYTSGNEIGVELKDMLGRLHEKKKLEQKERKERKESGEHSENGARTPRGRKNIQKNVENSTNNGNGGVIVFDKLEKLTLAHIFPSKNKKEQYYQVIDDFDGLKALEKEVDYSIQNILHSDNTNDTKETKNATSLYDGQLVHNSWGLDCEWKPSRTKGCDNPIATLQLCSNNMAFLVDLQTLCQPFVKNTAAEDDASKHNIKMNKMECYLSGILSKLFSHPELPILGFGIGQDILKLAASFPHVSCFALYHSIIDLHEVSRMIYSNEVWKKYMTSLRKTVAFLVGKSIDKKEQCSDWSKRPLCISQICYATLDAAILRLLLSRMLLKRHDKNSDSGNCVMKDAHDKIRDGQFLASHPDLRMSVRFTLLDQSFMKQMDHPHDSYRMDMGRVKKALDLWFARQSWPSSSGRSPALPERLSSRLDASRMPQNQASEGSTKGKVTEERKEAKTRSLDKNKDAESTVPKRTKTRGRKPRNGQKSPVMILDVPWDPQIETAETALHPGDIIGYMKENCVERIIGQSFLSSMPESSYLSYNRRGGVVELANAWVLFVNFGVGKLYAKYQNEFKNKGRDMTFYVKPHKVQEASLIYYLSVAANARKGEEAIVDVKDIKEKKIFLFVRPSSNSKFVYCGKCVCKDITVYEEDVMLLLNLEDYDHLVSATEGQEEKCDYVKMVGCHQQSLVDSGESTCSFN